MCVCVCVCVCEDRFGLYELCLQEKIPGNERSLTQIWISVYNVSKPGDLSKDKDKYKDYKSYKD